MEDNRYPLISIIILNYNGKGITGPCLASILASDYANFEVIVVDNASNDRSLEEVIDKFGRDNRVKFIRNNTNLFFTRGNNKGISVSRGEYIFILNNDTEIANNCLSEIVKLLQDDSMGAAQPKILIYGQGPLIDNTGGMVNRIGYSRGRGNREIDSGQYDYARDIFFAGGTAMVVKSKVLKEVGTLDEKFIAHWEDIDLSWRIRLRGYKIVFIPKAIVYHKLSQTINKFGDRSQISFHIRKNRISGLIKNYGLLNLIKYLPLLILTYFILFIKEFIFDRNFKVAFSSILAILWNVKEMPYLIKERRIVQKEIRRVGDKKILEYLR